MRAFLFPGQGSQYIDMGKDLYYAFSEFKFLFEKISTLSEKDLKKIIFNNSEKTLKNIEDIQICIFAISLSILEILKKKKISAQIYLGHSLGEISAYVASGILSLHNGIKIVMMRSKIMYKYSIGCDGAMLACINIPLKTIQTLIYNLKLNITIACINSNKQVVLSGNRNVLNIFIQSLKNLKKDTKFNLKTRFLKVNGAFHSPFFRKASRDFFLFLKSISFNETKFIVYSNFKSILIQNKAKNLIPIYLAKQISHPIYWLDIIKKVLHLGVKEFIEVGPNKILSNLLKDIDPNIRSFQTDSLNDIENLLKTYN